ncbi:hypothetical protein L3X38_022569 [Prunus dulcis]|uniref:Uncharacterized protein n=1 Tax=Prunus dulcis TaxID=3755 RepID=A0AAD4Z4F4_PRUDU|nr:hypothetical protein L3X38_022569 [Prunus dulcis]
MFRRWKIPISRLIDTLSSRPCGLNIASPHGFVPGIALASNSLNFGVLTTPKPVSSQKASSKFRVAQWTAQLHLARYCPLWAHSTVSRTGLFLGAHGATSQGVTHPGIAPASNSLNFGVPTNPKPVSSQKASR